MWALELGCVVWYMLESSGGKDMYLSLSAYLVVAKLRLSAQSW